MTTNRFSLSSDINELPSSVAVSGSDLFAFSDDPASATVTRKITFSGIRTSIFNQPTTLQFRQGTNTERTYITPSSGEPIWTTDNKKLFVGDGSSVGGILVGPYTPPELTNGNSNSGTLSIICGGTGNNIANGSTYSNINGGLTNYGSGVSFCIAGGNNNSIGISGSYCAIGGGQGNNIQSQYSTIAGGFSNLIGTSVPYSTIGGGVSNRCYATGVTVCGGALNFSYNAYGTICGGFSNIIYGDYATIIGGNSAKTTLYGQVSHAAGSFANRGDAQHTTLIARRETSDTTDTVLTLDGLAPSGNNIILLTARTCWMFTIKLSAYNDSDNIGASWLLKGGIRRNNSNQITLVGAVTSESWIESGMSGTSVSVTANDTSDTLEITVKGLAGKNIRWVALLDICQASYGVP
jgi:hypothetical protein